MSWQFDLCGGHLAVDFANTVSQRHTPHPVDHLSTYEELVDFALQTGTINESEARGFLAEAEKRPADAQRVLKTAMDLRDALYGIFAALARGEALAAADLAVINECICCLRFDENLQWEWRHTLPELDGMLGPIVRAAVELLSSDRRERVSMCDASDCVWVFLDTSKNHSRRWCDMDTCGNREKARRFLARQRAD